MVRSRCVRSSTGAWGHTRQRAARQEMLNEASLPWRNDVDGAAGRTWTRCAPVVNRELCRQCESSVSRWPRPHGLFAPAVTATRPLGGQAWPPCQSHVRDFCGMEWGALLTEPTNMRGRRPVLLSAWIELLKIMWLCKSGTGGIGETGLWPSGWNWWRDGAGSGLDAAWQKQASRSPGDTGFQVRVAAHISAHVRLSGNAPLFETFV